MAGVQTEDREAGRAAIRESSFVLRTLWGWLCISEVGELAVVLERGSAVR